eukprot:TRINITY_DN5409_c0_g1_i1.p2 TRINITY_DN5409_c0_g1~~TRINITY_DN5409_c0_g1_i1.p2  ORF type:complete len:127 (-),score=35.47 TRINITY_DN5409_c0_g1_i1:340-675(-)
MALPPPSPIKRVDLRQLYRALLRARARLHSPPPPLETLAAYRTALREADPAIARRRYYDGLHELGALKRAAALSKLFDGVAPAGALPAARRAGGVRGGAAAGGVPPAAPAG